MKLVKREEDMPREREREIVKTQNKKMELSFSSKYIIAISPGGGGGEGGSNRREKDEQWRLASGGKVG